MVRTENPSLDRVILRRNLFDRFRRVPPGLTGKFPVKIADNCRIILAGPHLRGIISFDSLNSPKYKVPCELIIRRNYILKEGRLQKDSELPFLILLPMKSHNQHLKKLPDAEKQVLEKASFKTDVDTRGRIAIPFFLQEELGFSRLFKNTKLISIGMENYIEIWKQSDWQTFSANPPPKLFLSLTRGEYQLLI